MPLNPTWDDIALRLLLTVVAGALVGVNRTEGGHAAGLRTTLLVCLAASVAMIQTNLLLSMGGKGSGSFASLDLMRLPLGILTGMGFIGGGAILRRGDAVIGVTTAATLWLVTVIGLCLGGGQTALGLVTLAVTLAVLWGLKGVEGRLGQVHSARIAVVSGADGPSDSALRSVLGNAGFAVVTWSVTARRRDGTLTRTFKGELRWKHRPGAPPVPPVVNRIEGMAGVKAMRWEA